MSIFYRLLSVLFILFIISGCAFAVPENKIKFDSKTYNLANPESKSDKFVYLLKNENIGNWHTKIFKELIKDSENPTEAAAEFAYKIQEENPKAAVLVYPEAATLGYLTFNPAKSFYEYNVVVFKKSGVGVEKLGYAKRFYAEANGGESGARTAAILFAEKNNKKYMEMINKLALK